ncbi:hypothetical protein B7486_01925 [cyanobacterium TDX16]|nr:hypothetical protein B7486_01925 [cyanobacterium TDX16]HKQ48586.1 hypothetical protein [Phycisphaerae bacterium]
MAERRTLTQGLKETPPPIDTAKEKAFVFGEKEQPKPAAPVVAAATLNRVPISTRIRDDFARALKRASLERQLEGREPNTLQDILEEAIEPWLKANGYLS